MKMTKYFIKFVLVFLLGIINSSLGLSSASENYEQKTLKDLCGQHGYISNYSQTLQLGSMNNPYVKKSALILYTNYWNGWYYNSYSSESFKCTFTVKAAPGEQIYATIQSMTFESNPNGGCKDYIKFSGNNDVWPDFKLFCGKYKQKTKIMSRYDIRYEDFDDSNVIPKSEHLSYDAKNDELKVEIFISRDNIKQNLQNTLVVIFTPYTRTEILDPKYKINEIYQCDGIENCNDYRCDDEKNCDIDWSKIFLITSLLFSGIILTSKVCKLWKNGELCCNSNRHENNASSQSVDNQSDDIFFIEPENHPNIHPSLDTLPSYESLFPVQSTTSLNTNESTTTTPKIVTNPTAENPQTNI